MNTKMARNLILYIPLILLVLIFGICFFVSVFFFDEANCQCLEIRNQAPSWNHVFGTDSLGRDIFFRECIGGRTSIIVALICTFFTTFIGSIYGGIAALVEKLDKPLLVILDVLVSIPDTLIVLTLSLLVDCRNIASICFIICILGWCKMARLVRDLLKPLRNNDFVLQSRLNGKKELFIVARHMIPNVFPTIMSRAVLSFAEFMFYESFLSYLGIGLQPPAASWGTLIANAQSNFAAYPYQLISYCGLLFITLLAVNCIGEALRKNYLKSDDKNIDLDLNNSDTVPVHKEYEHYSTDEKIIKDSVLSVRNLSVYYNNTQILKNICLDIFENEVVGVVGNSGCGKTTLARTIAGTIQYYGGKVSSDAEMYFCGQKVTDETKNVIAGKDGIAVVPQNPISSLDPTSRIGRQLGECIKIGGVISDKEIKHNALLYLREVGVDEPEKVLKRYPHELSGGIAQRILIAMAIATKPKLIICDEPTASLDSMNQKRIVELINREAHLRKVCVVFISHDMKVIEQVTTRIVHIVDGVIEQTEVDNLPKKELPIKCGTKDNHTKNTVLRVEHLVSRYYRQKWVINDISFKLKTGETFGIVGESGCGKTTLIKSLLKSLVIEQIPIEIKSSSKITVSDISRIQYIFQNPASSFDPLWTIQDSLSEGVLEKRNRLLELIQTVGLDQEVLNAYPNQLSIGQCQRAAIVRAILHQPQLLICDEPTSSMDVLNQKIILYLLSSLIEQNEITTIFISHDLEVVLSIADRIAIMYKGRIVEVVATSAFNSDILLPHHPYTQGILKGRVFNEIEDDLGMSDPIGCLFYPYCKYRTERCRLEMPVLKKIGKETVDERHHFIACFSSQL